MFYCELCGLNIPPEFQEEHLIDLEDNRGYHLSQGCREIRLGTPEWENRVLPAIEDVLRKLNGGD